MLKRRKFCITLMEPGKPSAEKVLGKADREVRYSGREIAVRF